MIIGKASSGPYLILEECCGSCDILETVKSKSKYKSDIVEKVKVSVAAWMKNPHFQTTMNLPLDLAIIIKVSSERMQKQDVDNIAKIVLDALKETPNDPRFLFHDDRQVVRLLIWKLPRTENDNYITDTLSISFRVHNPKKQMILVNPIVI